MPTADQQGQRSRPRFRRISTDGRSTSERDVEALRAPVSVSCPQRRGPRPLALHVTHAECAWRNEDPKQLANFYRGVRTYRQHPYCRIAVRRPEVWRLGGNRLLDFGPEDGWPLLVIPSLINRAYILDLMPGNSLLAYLGQNGVRPLLFDWGDSTAAARRLPLEELLTERLEPALDWLLSNIGKRPLALGYCMGGTLATALACLRRDDLAGLTLLATPWDFDAGRHSFDPPLDGLRAFATTAGLLGGAPVDLLQTSFAHIDPLSVPSKFARFGKLATASHAATRFVAIEDWLNDGVPLGAEVSAECLMEWYGSNAPARGAWRVNGSQISPEKLDLPSFLAIPERDRIVSAQSALALVARLPDCEVIRPNEGHISMIAGQNARHSLWSPLLTWLERIAAMQKNLGEKSLTNIS